MSHNYLAELLFKLKAQIENIETLAIKIKQISCYNDYIRNEMQGIVSSVEEQLNRN